MTMLKRRMFLGLAAGATLAGCGYRSVDAVYSQPAGAVPKQYANRTRVVFWSPYGGVNGKAVDKLISFRSASAAGDSRLHSSAEIRALEPFHALGAAGLARWQAVDIP